MPSKENRRSPRAHHDSAVEIFDSSGRLLAGLGRMVDLSQVGVCFSSTMVMTKGERVHCRVRTLREGVWEVEGRIVWARKKANATLYGVAFENLDKTHR